MNPPPPPLPPSPPPLHHHHHTALQRPPLSLYSEQQHHLHILFFSGYSCIALCPYTATFLSACISFSLLLRRLQLHCPRPELFTRGNVSRRCASLFFTPTCGIKLCDKYIIKGLAAGGFVAEMAKKKVRQLVLWQLRPRRRHLSRGIARSPFQRIPLLIGLE